MPPLSKVRAAWIATLLLGWCPAPAMADVAAGVAAYRQQDYAGALREFHQAAKRDDVRALNYLGIMYADGIGIPRDDLQAATMFSKAALLGFPEAMANLARMHAAGRGMPQDNRAAVSAYRAAARAGFAPAILRMAEIYENGEFGEAPDAAAAREWRARVPGSSAPAAAAPPVIPVPAPQPVAAVAAVAAPRPTTEAIPDARPLSPPAPAADVLPAKVAPPPNAIDAVSVSLEQHRVLIRVRTALPLPTAPVGFVVETPPRIVFDFPHTATGLGRSHEVSDGNLRSVEVIQGAGRTRLVLILDRLMRHEAQLEQRELLITLTPNARSDSKRSQ